MWERFSYYGMRALLVLYLTERALLPERAQEVLFYPALHRLLEGVFGPLSVQAASSQIYGLYTALVFFTPLLGGALADRYLGQRRAVFIGGVLIAAGHVLMAFQATLLLALLAIILGSGLFTPNISAQVGMLYAPDDARRERGYSLFYVGINLGGFLAPLACGTVGEIYGWDAGFSLAAIGMGFGLATYLLGRRQLPQEARPPRATAVATQATTARPFVRLGLIMTACVLFWAAIEQLGNSMTLWLRDASNLSAGDVTLRVTWFQSLNPLFILAGTPLLLLWWGRAARHGREPHILTKMMLGCLLVTAAYLLLALVADMASGGTRPHFGWTILAILLLTLGELYLSPTSWSLFSRLAPRGREALLMGLWLLPLFAGAYLAGLVGTYWERLPHPQYWLLVAAIPAVGALLLALLRSSGAARTLSAPPGLARDVN